MRRHTHLSTTPPPPLDPFPLVALVLSWPARPGSIPRLCSLAPSPQRPIHPSLARRAPPLHPSRPLVPPLLALVNVSVCPSFGSRRGSTFARGCARAGGESERAGSGAVSEPFAARLAMRANSALASRQRSTLGHHLDHRLGSRASAPAAQHTPTTTSSSRTELARRRRAPCRRSGSPAARSTQSCTAPSPPCARPSPARHREPSVSHGQRRAGQGSGP